MQILLDECLDWRLCRAFSGHHCVSVAAMGWSGLTNGQLLKLAEQHFDVFITADLTRFDLAVVVLEARSTRLSDTVLLMPQVLTALMTIKRREVMRLRA